MGLELRRGDEGLPGSLGGGVGRGPKELQVVWFL